MSEGFGTLTQLWNAGVASVSGRRCMADALARDGAFPADLVIAVGKAAGSMYLGALPCVSPATRSIVVTKRGHVDVACRTGRNVEVIEAGHPMPDTGSLVAGERILQAVAGAGPRDRLLLLVSGGASALAEVPRPGLGLEDLRTTTARLLGSGMTIAEINEVRCGMSLIKCGQLLAQFRGTEARVYLLSDVRGDSLATIGSGIGDVRCAQAPATASVVASNSMARNAVVRAAESLGLHVRLNEGSLYGDVGELARGISQTLARGARGVYVWGGVASITLQTHPGTGGRNQSLALALALRIRGMRGIAALVAGTDGTDGPTDDAGAHVDGETVDDVTAAETALRAADAGRYLGRRQCLFRSGPTGTNVMDLLIATVT